MKVPTMFDALGQGFGPASVSRSAQARERLASRQPVRLEREAVELAQNAPGRALPTKAEGGRAARRPSSVRRKP
jgi:hypothetical protein